MKTLNFLYLGIVLALLVSITPLIGQQPVDHWQSANVDPAVDWYLYGVAVNGDILVAYGDSNTLLVSTNGVDWSESVIRENDTFGSTSSMIYADGLFAGFYSGRDEEVWHRYFITSEDGIEWDSNLVETNISYGEVAYGNGIYVLAGGVRGNTDILTSTDGIEWTSHTDNPFSYVYGIKFGNGIFVIQGESGVATSTDGESWRTTDFGRKGKLYFCNNEFILITDEGGWFISDVQSQSNWVESSSDLDSRVKEIDFIEGIYFASLENESALAYSYDRVRWRKIDFPQNVLMSHFTFWKNRILSVGASGGIFRSDPIRAQLYFEIFQARGRRMLRFQSYGPLVEEYLEVSYDLIFWKRVSELVFDGEYSSMEFIDPEKSGAYYRLGNGN